MKANIDISHMLLSDSRSKASPPSRPRGHVHISTATAKCGDLPPGHGVVPFQPYLQAIKDLDFDGANSLELEYAPDPSRCRAGHRGVYLDGQANGRSICAANEHRTQRVANTVSRPFLRASSAMKPVGNRPRQCLKATSPPFSNPSAAAHRMSDFCDDYVRWGDVVYEHVEVQSVRRDYFSTISANATRRMEMENSPPRR